MRADLTNAPGTRAEPGRGSWFRPPRSPRTVTKGGATLVYGFRIQPPAPDGGPAPAMTPDDAAGEETTIMARGRGKSFLPMTSGLALGVFLAGTLASCYTYAPVDEGFPAPGVEARAYLTGSARLRMSDLLVPDQRWIEGVVLRTGPDEIVLGVSRRPPPGTPSGRILTQEVPLTRDDVGVLEVRELDRFRTGLVTGTLVAAGAAILVSIIRGRGEDTRDPPTNGGPVDARIPGYGSPAPPR